MTGCWCCHTDGIREPLWTLRSSRGETENLFVHNQVKTTEKTKMKIYDYGMAPNPRRVRIFLHEKGIEAD